jgi:hypothetical protein
MPKLPLGSTRIAEPMAELWRLRELAACSVTPFRSISRTRRSLTPSSPGGALAPGRRRPEASSKCGRRSPRRGWGDVAQNPMSAGTSDGTSLSGSHGGSSNGSCPAAHSGRCVEAYYLQRTRFESIAERKLRRRQLTEDGNVEISGRDLGRGPDEGGADRPGSVSIRPEADPSPTPAIPAHAPNLPVAIPVAIGSVGGKLSFVFGD